MDFSATWNEHWFILKALGPRHILLENFSENYSLSLENQYVKLYDSEI